MRQAGVLLQCVRELDCSNEFADYSLSQLQTDIRDMRHSVAEAMHGTDPRDSNERTRWLGRWFQKVVEKKGKGLTKRERSKLKLAPNDRLIKFKKMHQSEAIGEAYDNYEMTTLEQKTKLEVTHRVVLDEEKNSNDFFDPEIRHLGPSTVISSKKQQFLNRSKKFLAFVDAVMMIGYQNETPCEGLIGQLARHYSGKRPFGDDKHGASDLNLESRFLVDSLSPQIGKSESLMQLASSVWLRGMPSWDIEPKGLPVFVTSSGCASVPRSASLLHE